MKLSDQKFLARALEEQKPKPRQTMTGADLSKIKGIGDKNLRRAEDISGLIVPDENLEPVSFTHPETGRRVYGWLTAVDHEGNAQVEIGDGAYAIVPPTELHRIGEKEDRESIRAKLARAIGKVSFDTNGVRADLQPTSSLTPLDEKLQLLTLGYSTGVGLPTDAEVSAYVARFHPTAQIVEVDATMPGRVAIALAAELEVDAELDVEAELSSAVGGEVLETLDPATDVVEKKEASSAASKSAVSKSAVSKSTSVTKVAQEGPSEFGAMPSFEPGDTLNPVPATNKPSTTPARKFIHMDGGKEMMTAIAKAMMEMGNKDLASKVLLSYFKNGGTSALLQVKGNFNVEGIITAALATVQRADKGLWNRVITEMKTVTPDIAEAIDNAVEKSKSSTSTSLNPAATPASPENRNAVPPSGSPASERPTIGLPYSSRPTQASKRASRVGKTAQYEHFIREGLPPAMGTIFAEMSLSKLARRGDYTIAQVKWNPKHMENRVDNAVKSIVSTYVNSKCGVMAQGMNFGAMGKVYFLEFNAKKGEAQVQFSSEFAGPAPTEVVEKDD